MKKIECIARALCLADGRNPNHEISGLPQWRKYKWTARVVAAALKDRKP